VKKGSSVEHYAVLGVAQAASQAEVKQAYRQLALKHHPDKAPKPELRDIAESLFKHVSASYAVLSDVAGGECKPMPVHPICPYPHSASLAMSCALYSEQPLDRRSPSSSFSMRLYEHSRSR